MDGPKLIFKSVSTGLHESGQRPRTIVMSNFLVSPCSEVSCWIVRGFDSDSIPSPSLPTFLCRHFRFPPLSLSLSLHWTRIFPPTNFFFFFFVLVRASNECHWSNCCCTTDLIILTYWEQVVGSVIPRCVLISLVTRKYRDSSSGWILFSLK